MLRTRGSSNQAIQVHTHIFTHAQKRCLLTSDQIKERGIAVLFDKIVTRSTSILKHSFNFARSRIQHGLKRVIHAWNIVTEITNRIIKPRYTIARIEDGHVRSSLWGELCPLSFNQRIGPSRPISNDDLVDLLIARIPQHHLVRFFLFNCMQVPSTQALRPVPAALSVLLLGWDG